MGAAVAPIVSAVAGPIIGKVLGGGSEKKAARAQASAQAAETARLEQQRKTEAATAEAERKKKTAQRKATATIFGGAEDANNQAGVGNLGG